MPQNFDNNDVLQTIPYLMLDVPGAPKKFAVEDHLIVGASQGPMELTDATISARHASLFCQEGVVSVMDHRSEFGTYLNGKKLLPGKMYVILEDDEIKFGQLHAKIANGVRESLPQIPDDATTKPNLNTPIQETDEDDVSTSSFDLKSMGGEVEFRVGKDEIDTSKKDDNEVPPLPGMIKQGERVELTGSFNYPKEGTHEINIESLLHQSKGGAADLPGNKKETEQDAQVNAAFDAQDNSELEVEEKSGKINWENTTGVFKNLIKKLRKEEASNEAVAPKKHRIKVPKQKVIKVERTYQISNALLRMFAILIDIVVTYIFFDGIKEFPEIKSLFITLEENVFNVAITELSVHISNIPVIGGWIGLGGRAINTFFYGVTVYFLIRIVASMTLGVSVGQFCLGMRSPGSFIKKRLSGFFRELFSVFTSWFLIFDLPTVFSKRSFKELLTGSKICSASGTISTLLILIFIPFWLMMAMVLPLFQNFEASPSWRLGELNSGPTKAREVITQYSKYFGMGVPIDKGVFWMVPSINIKSISGKKILTPSLYFYHPVLKKEVKWSIYKRFNLGSLVSDALSLDPFAHKSFPIITELLKNVAIGSTVLKGNMTEEEQLKIRMELMDFIRASLKVAPANLMNHVSELGPFISSYVSMKNDLTHYFDLEQTHFEFVYLGDKVFLKGSDGSGNQEVEIYMPLELDEVALYRASFPISDLKKPFMEVSQNFSFQAGAAQQNTPSMAWIDKLLEESIEYEVKLVELLAYFKEQGKIAFENENFDYLALLEKSLKQNYSGVKKLKGALSEKLEISFQEMMLSFKDRNRVYFTGSLKTYKPLVEEVPSPEISEEEAEKDLFGE